MSAIPQETPIYLFMGFLEAGKTKFIQETLQDPRFATGEKTLLLVCEEGEEEYDSSLFASDDVLVQVIDKEENLTQDKLYALQLEFKIERVLIEYNGMWLLEKLFDAMPEGWMINQVMTFFDSSSFLSYNQNMRQLVFDKVQYTQMVIFNRFLPSMDKMDFHKVIRAISHRCDIVYEQEGGKTEMDDIEDPLPFDVTADVIEIQDKDYAIFYRDLSENAEKYNGKTLSFKGLVACDSRLPKGNFVIGRHVMTCCEADIQYSGLACVSDGTFPLKTRDWVEIKAKLKFEAHRIYHGKGPVLYVTSIKSTQKPEQELATFY